jgi:hypothetical protein
MCMVRAICTCTEINTRAKRQYVHYHRDKIGRDPSTAGKSAKSMDVSSNREAGHSSKPAKAWTSAEIRTPATTGSQQQLGRPPKGLETVGVPTKAGT